MILFRPNEESYRYGYSPLDTEDDSEVGESASSNSTQMRIVSTEMTKQDGGNDSNNNGNMPNAPAKTKP